MTHPKRSSVTAEEMYREAVRKAYSAGFEAAREAAIRALPHRGCMEHDVLPTSHTADCHEIQDRIRALPIGTPGGKT